MLTHKNLSLFSDIPSVLTQEINSHLPINDFLHLAQGSKFLSVFANEENAQWKKRLMVEFNFNTELANIIFQKNLAKKVCIRLNHIRKNNIEVFNMLYYFANKKDHKGYIILGCVPLFQDYLTPMQKNVFTKSHENFRPEVPATLIRLACDANNLTLLDELAAFSDSFSFNNYLREHAIKTNNNTVIKHFNIYERLASLDLINPLAQYPFKEHLQNAISYNNLEAFKNLISMQNFKKHLKKICPYLNQHLLNLRIYFFLQLYNTLNLENNRNFIEKIIATNDDHLMEVFLDCMQGHGIIKCHIEDRGYIKNNNGYVIEEKSYENNDSIKNKITNSFASLFHLDRKPRLEKKAKQTFVPFSEEDFKYALEIFSPRLINLYLSENYSLTTSDLPAYIKKCLDAAEVFTLKLILCAHSNLLNAIEFNVKETFNLLAKHKHFAFLFWLTTKLDKIPEDINTSDLNLPLLHALTDPQGKFKLPIREGLVDSLINEQLRFNLDIDMNQEEKSVNNYRL